MPSSSVAFDRRRLSSKILARTAFGAGAIALSLLAGLWLPLGEPVATSQVAEAPVTATALEPVVASAPYGGVLVDLRSHSRSALASLSEQSKPEPAIEASAASPDPESLREKSATTAFQFVESAPLPPSRPVEFGSSASLGPLQTLRRSAQNRQVAQPVAPSDNRSFIEKLFGASEPSGQRASGPALAYAAPETSLLDSARNAVSSVSPRYDRWTAVYDISAHTVYLPDGTKLEAHSGLGDRLDNPRYVHERMRGPTPPQVYELTPREQLFHGVAALRLNPVGSGNLFGRAGLLAHTYMLGPNGDSNGCVSFRNYAAFLQAYRNGEIKRLVVVASLN